MSDPIVTDVIRDLEARVAYFKAKNTRLRARLATAEQERDRYKRALERARADAASLTERIYRVRKTNDSAGATQVKEWWDLACVISQRAGVALIDNPSDRAALSATAPERDATGQMGGDNG